MEIKVLSYNVLHFENFKTGKIDFDLFASAIKETGADIIGLNEVHGKGDDPEYTAQVDIMAKKLGFYGYFAKACDIDGENNPFGNGILSRYPIVSTEIIPIADPFPRKYDGYYETRNILKAVIDAGEPISVFVTHFGLNPDEQENAVRACLENVCSKCIFMGDLNVTPDNPVIKPLADILTDTANSDEEMLSFPSDKPFKKIDYIFTGEGIKKISARVLPLECSDHRPYFAQISI